MGYPALKSVGATASTGRLWPIKAEEVAQVYQEGWRVRALGALCSTPAIDEGIGEYGASPAELSNGELYRAMLRFLGARNMPELRSHGLRRAGRGPAALLAHRGAAWIASPSRIEPERPCV